MWEKHLSPEWDRQLPKLQASVTAFQKQDLSRLPRNEAVLQVLGKEAEDQCWKDHLDEASRVVLVPSPHVGPYLGKFAFRKTLWLLFGARIPDSVPSFAPDLSRAEMLTRVAALADDTRLRILKLLADEGERKSSEIMERLELSQSATSRHLKHLCATSFLGERRCNGAKCYQLNGERVDAVLKSIATFLRRDL
jgi:DNA-binding transcriptional ArsR family regulator